MDVKGNLQEIWSTYLFWFQNGVVSSVATPNPSPWPSGIRGGLRAWVLQDPAGTWWRVGYRMEIPPIYHLKDSNCWSFGSRSSIFWCPTFRTFSSHSIRWHQNLKPSLIHTKQHKIELHHFTSRHWTGVCHLNLSWGLNWAYQQMQQKMAVQGATDHLQFSNWICVWPQLSCVQNSFWSPEKQFKAYVGAYVRLRFPRFCLRHKNFKELAYASLTANFPGKPKSEFLVKNAC